MASEIGVAGVRKIENGQLYHRKGERKPLNKQQEQQEPAWRLCIKTKDEKESILRSSHSTATGMYTCVCHFNSGNCNS